MKLNGLDVVKMPATEMILYLDPVSEHSKTLIEGMVPQGFSIKFARDGLVFNPEIFNDSFDYVLVAATPVTNDLIERFSNVKLIQKTGSGIENIDIKSALDHGIPVATTAGSNSIAVAELSILFMLALYRNLLELDRETKNGNWLMWDKRLQSYELKGKEIGLIGFGSIGRALSQRLKAFETSVSYYDIFRLGHAQENLLGVEFKTIKEIMMSCDIVSLHVPLNSSTRNLISHEQFELCKPTTILINTSRGAVVDEEALIKALDSRQIAGAALDTYINEPINKDNPLLQFSNVITTPHIGAGTKDTWVRVLKAAFDNIKKVSLGLKPENKVMQ